MERNTHNKENKMKNAIDTIDEMKTDIITTNVSSEMVNIIRAENEYHASGDSFLDEMISEAIAKRTFGDDYGF